MNLLVAQALSGAAVTSYFEEDRKFDVALRIKAADRKSVDAIGALQLAVPGTRVGDGPGTIALADVANIEIRQGVSRILREAGSRTVIVKLLSGRVRELNAPLIILSVLFVVKLGWFNA